MYRNYLDLMSDCTEFYANRLFGVNNSFEPYRIREPRIGQSVLGEPSFVGATKEHFRTHFDPNTIDERTIFSDGRGISTLLLDTSCVVMMLVMFYWTKRSITNILNRSTHLKMLKLRVKDEKRLGESVWRLIYYTTSSIWLSYSCFVKRDVYLLLAHQRQGYLFDMDLDEYIICVAEISFYLHATYAMLYEDVWRKDSLMMLIHHLAAILSWLATYILRVHRVTMIAVLLRSTCDVLLEVLKSFSSIRVQAGQVKKKIELALRIIMHLFTITYAINQLYYFPLLIGYHGMNLVRVHQLMSDIFTCLVTCCLIFFILDIIWFMFILRLYYRVSFANAPLEDEREFDSGMNENKEKLK